MGSTKNQFLAIFRIRFLLWKSLVPHAAGLLVYALFLMGITKFIFNESQSFGSEVNSVMSKDMSSHFIRSTALIPTYGIVFASDISDSLKTRYRNAIRKVISKDIGILPEEEEFSSIEELNLHYFKNYVKNHSKEMLIGLHIKNDGMMLLYEPDYTHLFDFTSRYQIFNKLMRICWEAEFGREFTTRIQNLWFSSINEELINDITNIMIKINLVFVIMSLGSIFGQIINDEACFKRYYMKLYGLTDDIYYFGSCMNSSCMINLGCIGLYIIYSILFQFSMDGLLFFCSAFLTMPIMLLQKYQISIVVSDFFYINLVSTLFPMITALIFGGLGLLIYSFTNSILLAGLVGSIEPSLNIFLINMLLLLDKNSHTEIWVLTLVFPVSSFIINFLLLKSIEYIKRSYINKTERMDYSAMMELCQNIRSRQQIYEEASEAANEVTNGSSNDYAIRLLHLTKAFKSVKNERIIAVNNVSLGVRTGSIFGFLGSNGAGKSTIINMLIGIHPPNTGQIEINGIEITNISNNVLNLVSVCPQDNNHLFDYCTPNQIMQFYGTLLDYEPIELIDKTNEIFQVLDLNEHRDKKLYELSGGNARKVAVAVAFLSRANVMLLDEPTANLDPVARHHVHQLILSQKDQKTFMICTHLIDEAELLCDTISIMSKGSIFVVGSPQYLSEKFGTSYMIDIKLKNEEDSAQKVQNYFSTKIPSASILVQRKENQVYSIPSENISVVKAFQILREGSLGDYGYEQFTCSSSSLQKVFVDVIGVAEQNMDDDLI